jgi:hypothetical protein
MVLDAPAGDGAFALHIGVQEAGEQPCEIGCVDQELGIIAEIAIGITTKALARPLAIRPIDKARDVAILGDGEGAVFTVVGRLLSMRRR